MRASRIVRTSLLVALATSAEGCVVFASIDDVSVPADETPGADADAATAETGVDSSAADVARDSTQIDAADARVDADAAPDSRPRDSALEAGDAADSSAGDAVDSTVDSGVDSTVDSGVDSALDTASAGIPDAHPAIRSGNAAPGRSAIGITIHAVG